MTLKTFLIEDFAKLAGVEPATARALLRSRGVKKRGEGSAYEWSSKSAMEEDLKKCREQPPKKKAVVKKATKKAVVKKKTKKAAVRKAAPSEGESASA